MESGRGGASPFLANHGYFVSTLSDDEGDDDFWSKERRKEHRHTQSIWSPEILERNIGRRGEFKHQLQQFSFNSDQTNCSAPASQHSNIVYHSQFHLKKSRACSEASKYSMERSHELLMMRSIHEADFESSEVASVHRSGQKNVNLINSRLQHYVMEPTREVVVTSRVAANLANLEPSTADKNWTCNLEDAVGDDYPDPIDMEIYYNQPIHNNQTHRHFTAHRLGSEVTICDWDDKTTQADTGDCKSFSGMTRPQRECRYPITNPADYPFRETACDRRNDITSQKQKRLSRQFRAFRSSQEHGSDKSKYHPPSINTPTLRSLDPVKNSDIISGISGNAHDFLQKSHTSIDDQITCHEKKSRMQDTLPVSAAIRRKHVRFPHPRRRYAKHQHQEACNDKGDTRIRSEQVPSLEDIWALANTEAYTHDGSLQAQSLAKQGAHWNERNTLRTSQPPAESKETTSNASDKITAPERGTSAARMKKNSKTVKHGAPSTQSAKEQLLSAVNRARRGRQNNTRSNASESIANESDEEGKFLDAESAHLKCLQARQLQTLNVIDYKTPEIDEGTTYRLMKRVEGTERPGVDEACDRKDITCNIRVSYNVTASENSRRKDGAFPNLLPKKENTNQTRKACISSELAEKESMENRKLTATSTVHEDQRLQVRVHSLGQPVEEKNVKEQEHSKEPRLVVESKSRKVIQVNVKTPKQHKELALQSFKLLKVLRHLQVQRPVPGNCYGNTMTNAAPRCGYMAQYLKMQKFGAQGTRRLLG
ncbi:hypothetical protein KC19_VG267400 [Ceratodon purpureus]|uniref:Uncharacterized protein n=1 Tax=Ceratodon purpureus TaxID=3225 RepID=A0A8T0HU04_CERPU|nr:hypothetical protein KC19_VG267400 [Ceratodon purpureus]